MEENDKVLNNMILILDKVTKTLGEPLEEFSRKEKNIIAAYVYGMFEMIYGKKTKNKNIAFKKMLLMKFGYKNNAEKKIEKLLENIRETDYSVFYRYVVSEGNPEDAEKANYFIAKNIMPKDTYEDFVNNNEIKLYNYIAYRMDTIIRKNYSVWDSRAGLYELKEILSRYS